MSCTPAGFCTFYRSVTAGCFPFLSVLNGSYYGIFLPLIFHCISDVYIRPQERTFEFYGKECRSSRDFRCSNGCTDWLAIWVILSEEGVNVSHTWEDGQNEYLVTRKINTGRGGLSVPTLGSSSWAHS